MRTLDFTIVGKPLKAFFLTNLILKPYLKEKRMIEFIFRLWNIRFIHQCLYLKYTNMYVSLQNMFVFENQLGHFFILNILTNVYEQENSQYVNKHRSGLQIKIP